MKSHGDRLSSKSDEHTDNPTPVSSGYQVQMVPRIPPLDDKAKRIIEILQQDGRASYADIGREINLSEASVRARVMRLCKDGVIKIVGVVDPPRVGYHRQAMLGIQVSGPVTAIANRLAQLEQIIYVVQTSGRFDLLLEVVCSDDQDLIRFKDALLTKFKEISHCESLVYLQVHKQEYNWGHIH